MMMRMRMRMRMRMASHPMMQAAWTSEESMH